ncbi:MAG: helix-turn-helix domain-containing protein [Pseudomonadota bacterium]
MLRSPLFTVHDAADLLKVKESTVRSLINEKRLRAIKVGKEWRIAEVDLLAFLNENANRGPDAESPS